MCHKFDQACFVSFCSGILPVARTFNCLFCWYCFIRWSCFLIFLLLTFIFCIISSFFQLEAFLNFCFSLLFFLLMPNSLLKSLDCSSIRCFFKIPFCSFFIFFNFQNFFHINSFSIDQIISFGVTFHYCFALSICSTAACFSGSSQCWYYCFSIFIFLFRQFIITIVFIIIFISIIVIIVFIIVIFSNFFLIVFIIYYSYYYYYLSNVFCSDAYQIFFHVLSLGIWFDFCWSNIIMFNPINFSTYQSLSTASPG